MASVAWYHASWWSSLIPGHNTKCTDYLAKSGLLNIHMVHVKLFYSMLQQFLWVYDFYLSNLLCLSQPVHLWMSSMVSFFGMSHSRLMASFPFCSILASVNAGLLVYLPVCHEMTCMMVCHLSHWCWGSCLLFFCLCFLCDFLLITSQLCNGEALTCIVWIFCVGVSWAGCIGGTVIMSPYLSWIF